MQGDRGGRPSLDVLDVSYLRNMEDRVSYLEDKFHALMLDH